MRSYVQGTDDHEAHIGSSCFSRRAAVVKGKEDSFTRGTG